MEYRPTLTLSEKAIAHLMADPALARPDVVRLAKREDASFGVMYGPLRTGDFATTYAGFTIAIEKGDLELVKGRELDYDHGFRLRNRPSGSGTP